MCVIDLGTGKARIHSIEEAAAAGDVTGWLNAATPLQPRTRALVIAADHQRLDVIDQLVAAGTPVDSFNAEWGRQALQVAAQNGANPSTATSTARLTVGRPQDRCSKA